MEVCRILRGKKISRILKHQSSQRYHLRFDWSNLPVQSNLAKRILASQSRCKTFASGETLTFKTHHLNNFGIGSDIHTWAASLCDAVENDLLLLARGRASQKNGLWIWMSENTCPFLGSRIRIASTNARTEEVLFDTPELNINPLRCYFGSHTDAFANTNGSCVETKSFSPKFVRKCSNLSNIRACPSIVNATGDISPSDWFAAAVEYLFQSLQQNVIEEALLQIKEAFPEGLPHPDDLVTVHIRWGDKGQEMKLQSIDSYVGNVSQILMTRPKDREHISPHIYLASEDPEAIRQFLEKAPKDWNIHTSGPTNKPGVSDMISMSEDKTTGLQSFGALLLSMESNRYILSTGSNWSRLINELRKNVVHPRCNYCTFMLDAAPGEEWWPQIFP